MSSEILKAVGTAMKFRSLKYYVGEAFVSVARNRLMSLSSIATVAACVFIVIFSVCIAVNLDAMLASLEKAGGITVIVDDALSPESVPKLYDSIAALPNVELAEYISEDDALADFASTMADEGGTKMIEMLKDDNPMGRYIKVTLDSSRNTSAVVAQISALGGVARVRHASEFTSMLVSTNNVIRIISLGMILVLSLLSVIIVMNTIKLTVNNRRTEITIMKYVGATEWFIKWPFIIEGIIIGIAGSLIPVALSWFIYDRAVVTLAHTLDFMSRSLTFVEGIYLFPVLIPLALFVGALIGTLGSITSMRRYLSA